MRGSHGGLQRRCCLLRNPVMEFSDDVLSSREMRFVITRRRFVELGILISSSGGCPAIISPCQDEFFQSF